MTCYFKQNKCLIRLKTGTLQIAFKYRFAFTLRHAQWANSKCMSGKHFSEKVVPAAKQEGLLSSNKRADFFDHSVNITVPTFY